MKTGAVNLFAEVQASSSCECREARIYLQIECDKAVPFALPRRNSICGKQGEAEYTKKPDGVS